MGVMDFIKGAGSAIGIGTTGKQMEKAKAANAKADAELKEAQKKRVDATRKHAQATKAKQQAAAREKKFKERQAARKVKEQADEAKKAEQLTAHVTGLGLKCKNLTMRYDDGTAYVSGTVANRATKERMILAIGNVDGVAQVRDSLRVAPARKTANTAAARARRRANGPAQTMHTVKSGDTLSKIAQKYLGDANRYPEIFKANQPMLTDPDLIMVGQVLRIPKK